MDAKAADLVLGLVGCGAMGAGIAQIAAMSGVTVRMADARAGGAAAAREGLRETLDKLAAKGKLSTEARDAALARLQPVTSLAELAGCHVVVEAVFEDLQVKRDLFAQLESIVAPDTVLATNTSSLMVTAVAAGLKQPQRVAGFHFFNPVPLMKVVEVIDGLMTDPAVGDFLMALGRRFGHTAVRAKDTPGFIVNHAGRGYGTEALRVLAEGVAEFHQIDRILRDLCGFRLGPFELLDLTALDVSHPVMESIYHQYYEEPRYRPQPLTRQMMAAGLVGRKKGRGFYRYDGGQQQRFDEPAAPPAPAVMPSVWLQPHAPASLRELLQRLGAVIDTAGVPHPESLIVVAPLGEDATSVAHRLGLDAARTVAVETLFPYDKRRVLMTTPATSPAARDAAHALLANDGVPVSVIRDSAGLVAQRVVATIVNIAADMAQQRIASPKDIDLAVTLGLNYPFGPLAWGDKLGAATLLTVLDNLHAFHGDPRYRASPWLKRRALLGLSLLTEEA